MIVSLEEAKAYLRVDSLDDDNLIASLLSSAQALVRDAARFSSDDWEVALTSEGMCTINDVEHNSDDLRSLLRISTLYALGYMYEHREQADYHDLVLTLCTILSPVREAIL